MIKKVLKDLLFNSTVVIESIIFAVCLRVFAITSIIKNSNGVDGACRTGRSYYCKQADSRPTSLSEYLANQG